MEFVRKAVSVLQEAPGGIRDWFRKPVLLFLIPTFLLLIIFSYIPFFTAFSYSLFQWDGMSPDKVFMGLGNFGAVLRNPRFLKSVVNVLILLVFGMVKVLTVPIIVAELLFALRNARSSYVYRVLFVIPMVVPMLVFLLIWQRFYQANGLFNQVIRLFGFTNWNHPWLGSPDTALGALIFMGFPWVNPIAVLLILSGLLAIPQDLLDAARVDGAGLLRRFFFVDLALILGQVKLLVVLTILGTIQEFFVQFIMTNGGPAHSTTTPGLHMFSYAFEYGRLGYASAVAVILFLVMLTLTVLNMRYIKSDVEYEAG